VEQANTQQILMEEVARAAQADFEREYPDRAEKIRRGEITTEAARAKIIRRRHTKKHTGQPHTVAERFQMREKKHKPTFIKVVSETRRVYATAYDGAVEFSRVTWTSPDDHPTVETFPERFAIADLKEITDQLEKADAQRQHTEP
jgi:hypothetical protein